MASHPETSGNIPWTMPDDPEGDGTGGTGGGGTGGGSGEEPPIPMNQYGYNEGDYDGPASEAIGIDWANLVEQDLELEALLSSTGSPTRVDNIVDSASGGDGQVYYGHTNGATSEWLFDIAFQAFQQSSNRQFADIQAQERHRNSVAQAWANSGVEVTRGPGGSVWVPAEAVTGQAALPNGSPDEILIVGPSNISNNVIALPAIVTDHEIVVTGTRIHKAGFVWRYRDRPDLAALGIRFVQPLGAGSLAYTMKNHGSGVTGALGLKTVFLRSFRTGVN